MYNEYYGLRRAPFNLTPDPEFLYLTAKHREALAGLTYAIMGRKGFVVLTGDAGTGKTTLLTRILGHLPVTRIQSSMIVNPTLTPSEFLESTLLDFGFTEIPTSKPQRIAALKSFLWKGSREGKISALVIDEAHKLSAEVLEEIRLLGNLECGGETLLQIALVGQSELDELLDRAHLRQFKQRIALRLAIEPLSSEDVKRYIVHRWTKAGGNETPFTADAFTCIAEASHGIPRVINVICDNVLMEAFGEASAKVELWHVIGVCRELHLALPAPQMAPPQVASGALEQPAPFAPEVLKYPIKPLARHTGSAPRRSLLARLALKLRFAHRIETA